MLKSHFNIAAARIEEESAGTLNTKDTTAGSKTTGKAAASKVGVDSEGVLHPSASDAVGSKTGGWDGKLNKKAKRRASGDETGDMEEGIIAEGEEIPETTDVEPPLYQGPERKLNRSEVSIGLSVLGKTADGKGYTYLKATCVGLNLTDITALLAFKHLQYVNVSDNNLTIDNLQVVTNLEFLVLIHADNNLIYSANLKRMKYLQVIIMNNNNISAVNDVYQPELSTLELGNNKIQKAHFDNPLPQLKCLDLRNNLLQEILELDFPHLDSLYLAGNKIKTLTGLERLVNLRILHLRHNPIKYLYGFDKSLTKLQYVNLRNCKISTLRQVRKLKVLPALDTLVMKGCPYMGGTGHEDSGAQEEEDSEVRIEVLATLPRLKRINKMPVTPEERLEAKELMMQWLEEGDKDEPEEIDEEIGEEEGMREE